MKDEQLATQELEIETRELAPVAISDFASLVKASQGLQEASKNMSAVSVSAEYVEFTKPEEKKIGIFAGFRTFRFKDREATIKAGGEQQYQEAKTALWMLNGKLYACSGVSLVNEIERNDLAVGTPIEITFKGKKENTKIFSVAVLVNLE